MMTTKMLINEDEKLTPLPSILTKPGTLTPRRESQSDESYDIVSQTSGLPSTVNPSSTPIKPNDTPAESDEEDWE